MKKLLTINASIELEVPEDFENIEDVISTSKNVSNVINFLKENGWDVDINKIETKEEKDERLKEEMENYVPKISEIKYVRVRAGVRHWGNSYVNGERDDEIGLMFSYSLQEDFKIRETAIINEKQKKAMNDEWEWKSYPAKKGAEIMFIDEFTFIIRYHSLLYNFSPS